MPADDSRLFATALEVSVEVLKQEVREQARGALLRDPAGQLREMSLDGPPMTSWDVGYTSACSEIRLWMVNQSATGDLNAGNETT
jgi:hypothetical protein